MWKNTDKPSTHWNHFDEYLHAYRFKDWNTVREYMKGITDANTRKYYHNLIKKHHQYLKHHRIELNDVVAEAGAERFWNWLKEKLVARFPERNYNRAVEGPEYVLPDSVHLLYRCLIDDSSKRVRNARGNIQLQLQNYEGIIEDVELKRREIEYEMLYTHLMNNEDHLDFKEIIEELDELRRKYYPSID